MVHLLYGTTHSGVSECATLLVHLPCSSLKSCAENVIAVLKKMTRREAERLRLKRDFVANPGDMTPSF